MLLLLCAISLSILGLAFVVPSDVCTLLPSSLSRISVAAAVLLSLLLPLLLIATQVRAVLAFACSPCVCSSALLHLTSAWFCLFRISYFG